MAYVEEVFENNGKLYGASTGREYSSSEVETKNYCKWSKPGFAAPGEITLEVRPAGQSTPEGNGPGKKYSY